VDTVELVGPFRAACLPQDAGSSQPLPLKRGTFIIATWVCRRCILAAWQAPARIGPDQNGHRFRDQARFPAVGTRSPGDILDRKPCSTILRWSEYGPPHGTCRAARLRGLRCHLSTGPSEKRIGRRFSSAIGCRAISAKAKADLLSHGRGIARRSAFRSCGIRRKLPREKTTRV